MPRKLERAWMEVDLRALCRNARALAERSGVPLIPMIKADAYGLGAEPVARALEAENVLAYGIASVDEGCSLRTAGVERDILVFTPLLPDELEAARAARLTPTLGCEREILDWSRFGLPYHLSVDTGMARAGVPWREIADVLDVVRRHPPEGAFTHFHSAERDDGTMEEQQSRFRQVLAALPTRPKMVHTDGSAAIARHGKSEWDAIRPGIFLYGVGSGRTAAIQPEPVVHVKARIAEIRWIEAGDSVSYDATYVASSRRRIATLPIGYADGMPRSLGNSGGALVRGREASIVGVVTMDMMMLDVTDVDCDIGDVATVIGKSEEGSLLVETVAAKARMSPYELLTGLRGRLPRRYIEGES
jgi:alanine racemase